MDELELKRVFIAIILPKMLVYLCELQNNIESQVPISKAVYHLRKTDLMTLGKVASVV
jgi:hypothetical protein